MIDRVRGILSTAFSGTSDFLPHYGYIAHLLEDILRPWLEPVNLIYFHELMSRVLGSWRFSKPHQMSLEENVAQSGLFQGNRHHLSPLCKSRFPCLQFVHSS